MKNDRAADTIFESVRQSLRHFSFVGVLMLVSVSSVTYAASSTILGLSRYTDPKWFDGYYYHYEYGIQVSDGIVYLGDLGVSHTIRITGSGVEGQQWLWRLVGPGGEDHGGLTLTYHENFSLEGQTYSKCYVYTNNPSGSYHSAQCGGTYPDGFLAGASFYIWCSELGSYELTYNGVSNPFETISSGPEAQVFFGKDLVQLAGETVSPIVIPLAPGNSGNSLIEIINLPTLSTGVPVSSVTEIPPQIIGGGEIENSPPGYTDVTVRVTESGCPNYPIPDADVQLVARTVAGSGGHEHLVERDGYAKDDGDTLGKRFGTFSRPSADTLVRVLNGTPEGETDDNGEVKAIFTAGNVGYQNEFIATATLPASNDEVVEGRATLDIRYPGLVEANFTDARMTGSKPIHPQNHFGTPDTIARIQELILSYKDYKTRMNNGQTWHATIGINDMSLPFGGAFTLDGSFDPTRSHTSHEVGIDVDIDTKDSLGNPLLADADFLDRKAKTLGGWRYSETSLHFRFSRPRVTTN